MGVSRSAAERIEHAVGNYALYAGLAIGTAITALTPFPVPDTAAFWVPTAGLVIATAAWTYYFVTRPIGPPKADGDAAVAADDARRGAVFVVGLVVLMALLVHRSPWYAFMALGGYAYSYHFLRGGWRFVAMTAVAALHAYSTVGGGLTELTPVTVGALALITALIAVVSIGFTVMGEQTSAESKRRGEIIEELNQTNRRLAETLDENATLHARLLAQARDAGIHDERARMAREIHDTIAQGLTGVVTQLEAAGAAEEDAQVRRRHVDTARALARESLTEARRSVAALGPGQLVEARLPDAVADMAKKWAETAGVEVVLDTTGDPYPLVPELEVALFRVAQEALANVGRHAGASRAGLTLSYMDDVVVLDVRDDGAGFDPDAPRERSDGSGYGLAAMEQRVRRVSGTFTVESAPGEGTAISASVPAIAAAGEQP